MASQAELGILLSATDTATAVFRGFAGAGIGAVIGALSDNANAAAADEANVARLQQAIENSGVAWNDVTDAIEARIKKGQDLAFTDDQVRDSLGALTQTTGSVAKAMDLQVLAMDLARAKGMDLTAASEIIGKVSEGNTGILKRYGVVLEAGATSTEALAALQQKFGGQAEVYGQTTAAAVFKVHDAIDEWREGIGHAMGPAMGLVALLPGLESGFAVATSAGAALSTLIKGPMIASFLASIPATLAAMAPFLPFIVVIGAIALAIGLLKLAWDNNLGGIQEKAAAVLAFVTGLFNDFGAFFTGLWNSLPGPIQAAINVITAPIQGLISLVQTALGWLQTLGQANANSQTFNAQAGGMTTGGGDYVPVYAEGTAYVPRTGLAMLHQGEAVVPADQNRGGGGMTVNVNVGGSVIGVDDLSAHVRQAVIDGYRDGGFRGTLR